MRENSANLGGVVGIGGARMMWILGLLAFALSPALSHARDLQGRLGLGYNAQFANFQQANRVPGVSLKYAMTRDIAAELVVGVGTTDPGNSVAALKLFKNIFLETNLNFYSFVGGGRVTGGGNSGLEFQGGFGVEFFIPGIESLGLSMETGASFNNLSGGYALQTMGVSFLNAGMHFYF
jgi:hypothetical protein